LQGAIGQGTGAMKKKYLLVRSSILRMKKITALALAIALLSCNQKRNHYKEIIRQIDSLSITYEKSERVVGMTGTILNKYKEVLTRNIHPEAQRSIANDVKIELYKNGRSRGTLEINLGHTDQFANFNSPELNLGFLISYSLGMSLDELADSAFKISN
jgi:hypothetical protein